MKRLWLLPISAAPTSYNQKDLSSQFWFYDADEAGFSILALVFSVVYNKMV